MEQQKKQIKKVGILTSGGLAPCLSASLGGLILRYTEIDQSIEIVCYIDGYKGLLLGDSILVTPEIRNNAGILLRHGGSPIGNSRVKLTNPSDCVKRGYIKEGQVPLQVAADQLVKDKVDVLHTIGGDDTNTQAAELSAFLKQNKYDLLVVGLPKTIDNDVYPIKQSLGALTAAQEGAKFFSNVVSEYSANPRMLIIHEIMGRNCGYLTAATAREYKKILKSQCFIPQLKFGSDVKDIHGVYIPEMPIDIDKEAERLKKIMDQKNCVNIFISEGAGAEEIAKQLEKSGQPVPRDAFGHLKLDAINPGQFFGKQFADKLKAEKVLVQKSGYYSRAAPACYEDLYLIKSCVDLAVECALKWVDGVIGHDEDHKNTLRAIEFSRIKGGKPFDVKQQWFQDLLKEIGQH